MTLSQGLSVCSGGSSPALLSALLYNNIPQDIQTHFSQQYKESSTSSGCNSSPLSPVLFIHSCICAAKRTSIIYHLLSSGNQEAILELKTSKHISINSTTGIIHQVVLSTYTIDFLIQQHDTTRHPYTHCIQPGIKNHPKDHFCFLFLVSCGSARNPACVL